MHQQRRTVTRLVAESVVGIAALALLTWAAHRLHVRSEPAAVLYLCLVLLVSLRGRIAPALLVAVGATAAWDYFFTGSAVPLARRELRDVVTLVAFAATAVVITRLVTALRTSEGRWRNVFENNPTMYFMIDGSGTVLSVNPAGAEQLGYTGAELVGQPVLNVFLEEDKAAAREHLARCLAQLGKSMSWELRKVRKDGTMLWVRETARAVQLGAEPPVVLIACEDITEQKAVQDKLRENEARLRWQASLLDLTHDAIFVRSLNDVIIYWNRGAEQLYGWSKEEAVGRVTHELLRTEFPEPLDEITAAVLRTGHWDGELVHTKRGGTRIVVASRWSVQRNVHEQPAGVLETNNDITERKRAEEELRRSEAYLAEAQRVSHTGSWAWDVVAKEMVHWSEEQFRTYGLDPKNGIPGWDRLSQFMHPDDRARVLECIGRAIQEKADCVLDYRAVLPDGTLKHIHSVGHPVLDASGKLVEFVGTEMDVTAQKKAEETTQQVLRDLRESARRYRNIFQMADVSIWEEDFSQVKVAIEELKARGVSDFRRYFVEHPEFVAQAVQLVRVLDVNDATLRLFGAASKDELLVSLHRVFTPETLNVFAGELLAVAEGRTSFAAETTLQSLGGDQLDVVFTIAFPPEPADLKSVLVSIMDVTARKQAEEALRTAQTELARASTLTTMGQLAGSIAHELRQPLAAIAMNGSATLRWLNRESPDLGEARDAASRIVREAQRADEVIRGVRALMGKSGLQREPLDMNDAVHQVLELARGELRRNDVSVQTDLDPTLLPALGDRVQLQQVLLNLIVNAIEAMAPVADAAKTLMIRTARAETGEVVVAVEDTGPGLDPATVQRIFDPFFTTKPNGLGLGLSISRSIVEAHGGQLSASPRSPHGTTFRFTIPTMTERTTSSQIESQHVSVGTVTEGLATT